MGDAKLDGHVQTAQAAKGDAVKAFVLHVATKVGAPGKLARIHTPAMLHLAAALMCLHALA